MKPKFPRVSWLSSLRALALAVLGLSAFCRMATAADSSYINYGTITDPPQIDAISFANYGSISVGTTDPFSTSDTLYFTNYGNMLGAVGWIFDNAPPADGVRQMADTFVNALGAEVQAVDVTGNFSIGVPVVTPLLPSYVWVHATNIVNRGLLSVGANGWLKLAGTNVSLTRSGLEVLDISQSGSFGSINFGTNFLPDAGIYDYWWGQTNMNFASGAIWNGQVAQAPPHAVQTIGFGGNTAFSIPFPIADAYSNSFGVVISVTNIVGIPNPGPVITNLSQTNIVITDLYFPTNIYKQAVFVGVSDPNTLGVGVHYFPSSSLTNPFATVAVEIAFYYTNVVTDNLELSTLYFYDTLASETNRGVFQNINSLITFRPGNYNLSRLDDGTYAFGFQGNSYPDAAFLYDRTTFSNNVVSGEYAGYRAFVDDLSAEPPPLPGGTVTNLPGRIQIFAQNLDMRSVRMRGMGQVLVTADHLVASSNAVVDCQNLSYTLSSTNGQLNVMNLAKDSVARLQGDLLAWSGLWSNSMTTIYMNNYSISNVVDTNGVTIGLMATQEPITNGAAVNLHTLLLDGDSLLTSLPVVTWDFIARTTNVVIDDNIAVVEAFLVDGQSLTLNGALTFSNAVLRTSIGTFPSSSISDWVYTNAPHLLYFTNNGALTLPNNGHFGDDGPTPYIDFVNNGRLTAASIHVKGSYIQNSGTLTSRGILDLRGDSGALLNGQSSSVGDTTITCDALKLSTYRLSSTGGALYLNVRDALSDAGPGSPNQITVIGGFNLPTKPTMGDLIGTAFQTKAPDFAEVDHTWAALDLGPSPAGYQNNVAMGKLIMGPVGKGSPLLFFQGAGAQNGLYVDLLDLTQLGTNFSKYIEIAPNLTIYYAAARMAGNPPNGPSGIPQEPEEYLDGQFGGHLRWVRDFAGPNSSTTVVVGDQTIVVNSALRNSKLIDSDGDGIPNFYDVTPFGGTNPGPNAVSVTAGLAAPSPGKPKSLTISWTAAPGTVYRVEVANDLNNPNWQPLSFYTNNSSAAQTAIIWDTNAPAATGKRFYRVGHSQ